jgi:hypothetical protein
MLCRNRDVIMRLAQQDAELTFGKQKRKGRFTAQYLYVRLYVFKYVLMYYVCKIYPITGLVALKGR